MIKRLLTILTALALALALAIPATAGPVLDRIMKSKVLRVGCDPTYPPLMMKNKKGEVIGFDADIAKGLAGSLKAKVKFVPMPFKDLLPALNSGMVDLVINGMTMTSERNTKAMLVGPYLTGGQSILTRMDQAAVVTGPGDLNKPSVRIGAAIGTTGEMAVKQAFSKAAYTPAANQEAALKLLLDKKVDVVVADYPFCAFASFRYRTKGIMSSGKPFTYEPFGIAVSSTDPLFANLLYNFLIWMKGSGIGADLERKWFQGGAWMSELAE